MVDGVAHLLIGSAFAALGIWFAKHAVTGVRSGEVLNFVGKSDHTVSARRDSATFVVSVVGWLVLGVIFIGTGLLSARDVPAQHWLLIPTVAGPVVALRAVIVRRQRALPLSAVIDRALSEGATGTTVPMLDDGPVKRLLAVAITLPRDAAGYRVAESSPASVAALEGVAREEQQRITQRIAPACSAALAPVLWFIAGYRPFDGALAWAVVALAVSLGALAMLVCAAQVRAVSTTTRLLRARLGGGDG